MILKEIIAAKIIEPNTVLRPLGGAEPADAVLNAEGQICFEGKLFDDADEAMKDLLGEKVSGFSSNGLQFWAWFSESRGAWTPLEHARAQLESLGQKKEIKTSDTHPLRIDYVSPVNCAGRIGMTICPGKKDDGLYGGRWERDLSTDLMQISQWGAKTLITLMEAHEFDLLGVPEFEATLVDHSMAWLHLPIKDINPPGDAFEQGWKKHKQRIFQNLQEGEDIVLHCRGGLGRTGMISARILVEMGEESKSAVSRVRSARERTIETFAQEQYILNKQWQSS